MGQLTPRSAAAVCAAVGPVRRLVQLSFDRSAEPVQLRELLGAAATCWYDPIARGGAADIDDEADLPAADTLLIWAPAQRRLARRWLCRLLAQPPQRLILVGERSNGIDPLLADAGELFGVTPLPRAVAGLRLAVLQQPQPAAVLPDWAAEDGIRPGSFQTFAVDYAGQHVLLLTLPGVFSAGHLDPGSALLLSVHNADTAAADSVLDLGCGAGVLGIAAALRGARVTFSDVNQLACSATRANLQQLGLNGEVIRSDGGRQLQGRRFNRILCNPPFHQADRRVDPAAGGALLAAIPSLLTPDGSALIVANRFLPYERLFRQWFTAVTVRAANSAYTVWQLSAARQG